MCPSARLGRSTLWQIYSMTDLLGRFQVDRLGAFAALVRFGFKGNPHAFIERADLGALYGRDMHENILAPLIRRDEAEPFRLVEKLYGSSLPHARSPCPREELQNASA